MLERRNLNRRTKKKRNRKQYPKEVKLNSLNQTRGVEREEILAKTRGLSRE